jgi:peroxiredoxin
MALPIGTEAPDFTLPRKTSEGFESYTLSDNFGTHSTVLLFFPFAFTSVCMSEMCSVRDSFHDFEALDAQVYGISVDSPFTLEEMARKEQIPFPLLSDFNREVASRYDVLYDELLGLRGVAKRSALVVGKDGRIAYSWSSDDPKNIPDFQELQRSLSAGSTAP